LPGDPNGDSCGSAKHFASNVVKCNNSLASGTLFNNIDNLFGEKAKAVNARLQKKLGATGPWWQEMDDAGRTRVTAGAFTNLSPEDFSVREPLYVDKLTNGTAIPPNWKPTLNPDYDVVSGKIGSLAKDARSLLNPGIPSVLTAPASEALLVGNITP